MYYLPACSGVNYYYCMYYCMICIIYLHVACLKVTIAMFCFCHLKNPLNTMKTLIPSLYILEKNLLVNKYKKQMCYK